MAGAAVVATSVVTVALATAPVAAAAEYDDDYGNTEQTQPEASPRNSDDATGLINIGDLQLLSNLAICPDVNALIPIGNVLGILGSGTATATTADAPITCTNTSTGRQVGDRPAG
jgi:hypothetical protein